jgi:hypothetical protein
MPRDSIAPINYTKWSDNRRDNSRNSVDGLGL